MQFRTEIEKMPSQQPISCRDGIFVLGSCFADNIGQWLSNSCLEVVNNPFGVLYNPASIVTSIEGLHIDGCKDLQITKASDNLYYSFLFHGKYYAKSKEELEAILSDVLANARAAWEKAKHVLVTFGTSWVYERNGEVVANCHKFPAKEFTRRRLSVDEIVEMWCSVIKENLQKHFVFTVSPIRHIKDTLHGNQLSKSALLLAIDKLCTMFPSQVEYLPIYELLIDDLRDYRFYADDLVHPSTMAIEVVKQYFVDNCLDPECREFLREVKPLVKADQHRPLHPESEAYTAFKCQNNLKLEQLERKYSIFGLSKLRLD